MSIDLPYLLHVAVGKIATDSDDHGRSAIDQGIDIA
jgi:hypothetical protein